MATWYDLTFNYGSILTALQLTRLDGNLDALAEGASGSPSVQTAALENDAVTTAKLAADAVRHRNVQWSFSEGTFTVAGGGTKVLPEGLYILVSAESFAGFGFSVDAYHSATGWQEVSDLYAAPTDKFIYSDGTNVRLVNNAGSSGNVRYLKLD